MRGRLGRRQRPNLLGTAARTAVIAGTASAVTGAVRRRHNNNHNHGNGDQAAPPPVPGITDDQLNRLERLAELRKSDVLSEDEFQVEKARILDRTPAG